MGSNPELGALRGAALAVMVTASTGVRATHDAIQLAPHRAVYDVALEHATPSSGIAELTGRMVYELTGNACEGYAQRFRYVTVSTDHEGAKQTGDLRSTSWEDAGGRRLRFSTSNYQNHELSNTTEGSAGRKEPSGRVGVELTKPAKRGLEFPRGVHFPMQHSAALLSAARAGERVFSADLYDGSEKGDKISQTTAVIGPRSPPGSAKPRASLRGGSSLEAVPSWPVSIGFFEPSAARTDAVPTAEQSFRYYANGVSTDLVSNFGDYTLRFDLKELTLLEPGNCPGKKP